MVVRDSKSWTNKLTKNGLSVHKAVGSVQFPQRILFAIGRWRIDLEEEHLEVGGGSREIYLNSPKLDQHEYRSSRMCPKLRPI